MTDGRAGRVDGFIRQLVLRGEITLRCRILQVLRQFAGLLSHYWLLAFFTVVITYLELVFRVWHTRSINRDFVFPALFALSSSVLLFFL